MTALKGKWSGFEFVQMILYRRWKSHHLVERAVRTVSARSRTLPWEPGMSRVTDTSMEARYEQGHGHFNGSQVWARSQTLAWEPGMKKSLTLPWEPGMILVWFRSRTLPWKPGKSRITATSMGAKYEPGHRHFHGSQVWARSQTLPWEPGMSQVTETSMRVRYEPGHGHPEPCMGKVADAFMSARYERGHRHLHASQVWKSHWHFNGSPRYDPGMTILWKKPAVQARSQTLCVLSHGRSHVWIRSQAPLWFKVLCDCIIFYLILNRFTNLFQHSDQCKDEQSCECAAPGRFATNYTIFVKLNFQQKNGFKQINN